MHSDCMRGLVHLMGMLLGDADATGEIPASASASVSGGYATSYGDLPNPDSVKSAAHSLARSSVVGSDWRLRLPPHLNSVLQLIGGWLFDAALAREPFVKLGRAVALVALGKLPPFFLCIRCPSLPYMLFLYRSGFL